MISWKSPWVRSWRTYWRRQIDAVELHDLENDDKTEEETKRAKVDAASCNPKLPKHMAIRAESNRPA